MKIAMLHWGFPPIIGGVETHLTCILPELVKKGHKVSLLTGTADNSPHAFDFFGAKIYRSQYFDLNWLFKSGFQEVDDNVHDVVYEFLNKVKPDVIHAHNMHYFSRYHIRTLEHYALAKKIPLVLTAHNSWTDKLFLDLTCKVNWNKIISISDYISRELMAVGVPEDLIVNLHHGIDSAAFSPGKASIKTLNAHRILKGKKQIVFNPARMGLAKGCDITIEAFRLVKNKFPDAFLLMSGSGNIIDWGLSQNKDIAFFMSLIKHLDLEDSVYLNTFSIDKEMPDLYRLADVIVYPSSVEEPFGLAMLEAMSTAKPIIVTNSGGMPEIIHNDVNGFVVQKRDHKALADKIIMLLSCGELRKRLGDTGRSLVEEKYTKAIYTDRLIKVYKEVIDTYSPGRRKVQPMAVREGDLI
ncbi:MAG: glycosyltransferase family 4 protein [Candidatus Margulisbacteria bacterium]|nr:glycosyltransferase family 4 protein [Candidatus Margulisiibacteriota bacterium]MBU1021059.1 glycosyltransferase family 4 protein [Candidatus Margulisiibacteriota bacterium]MBU1729734.1 glycosyltransferase family 4 protein [Candidatus Margulisiibacteriota bacterium]MBU1955999.1 glycosyltransferase family 4 protein [Candidatus Margulisiibacteriota bacterium]